MTLRTTALCPDCEDGVREYLCSTCNGSGEGPADGTRCWFCKGPGVFTKSCVTCDGTGEVDATEEEDAA